MQFPFYDGGQVDIRGKKLLTKEKLTIPVVEATD